MTRYTIMNLPVEIDGRTVHVDVDFRAHPRGTIGAWFVEPEIEDVTVFLSDAEKARLPIPFPVAIRHFEDRVEQQLYEDLTPLWDFVASIKIDEEEGDDDDDDDERSR
jgi:hypothetical protein